MFNAELTDGKATKDDLHRKDWDGSSCGLVQLRILSNCPSVPQGGIIGRQSRVTFESKLTHGVPNADRAAEPADAQKTNLT